MRTAKILNARGLISPVPMTPGRFLSDPIGMLPGEAAPCLATRARNSMLRYARSSTCACQECDRPGQPHDGQSLLSADALKALACGQVLLREPWLVYRRLRLWQRMIFRLCR